MIGNGTKNRAQIARTVGRGLMGLTGADDEVTAWRAFFERGDVVGIKVNPVGAPLAGSSREVLWAVIDGLRSAGVAAKDMVVFDRYKEELVNAGMDRDVRGSRERGAGRDLHRPSRDSTHLIGADRKRGGRSLELEDNVYIQVLRAKLHHARVTAADVNYVGSITIDEDLMDQVGIVQYERVQVVDVENGSRLETYVMAGGRSSGTIQMNGAAARLVSVGDRVIIMAYGFVKTPLEGGGRRASRCWTSTIGSARSSPVPGAPEVTTLASALDERPQKAQPHALALLRVKLRRHHVVSLYGRGDAMRPVLRHGRHDRFIHRDRMIAVYEVHVGWIRVERGQRPRAGPDHR
jgi:aspartate 1-decarboxylase